MESSWAKSDPLANGESSNSGGVCEIKFLFTKCSREGQQKTEEIVKLRTFCTYVAYCHCGVLPQGVDEFIFRYFNGLTLIATNYCGHCPGERMIKF